MQQLSNSPAPESHTDSYSPSQRALGRIVRPILLWLTNPVLRILATFHVSPNLLSLLQIPLGILMIIVIPTNHAAVLFLIAACLTLDGLDGLLARFTGTANLFGALVDQCADQIREVLTVAAVAGIGVLSPVIGTVYGVLYPLTNIGLYLVNARGGSVTPTFKSVLTFYPFLALYLLGGPNWLDAAGSLTLAAMSLTVAQCLWALRRLLT